jgi:hypothetical protein
MTKKAKAEQDRRKLQTYYACKMQQRLLEVGWQGRAPLSKHNQETSGGLLYAKEEIFEEFIRAFVERSQDIEKQKEELSLLHFRIRAVEAEKGRLLLDLAKLDTPHAFPSIPDVADDLREALREFDVQFAVREPPMILQRLRKLSAKLESYRPYHSSHLHKD